MVVNNWIAANLIWITLAITILVLIYFVYTIIQTIRKKHRFVSQLGIILLILGLMFLIFLTYRASEIEGADWGQIILMIGLVAVTAAYASSAEKQAEASVKMAEVMVKPILIPYLKLVGDFDVGRYVQFEAGVDNDGNGPAYDIKGKIYDSTGEHNDKRSDSSLMTGDIAVVLRAHHSIPWPVPDPRLSFPHSDKVQRRFFVINYRDIHGEYTIHQPFVLTTVENNKPFALLEKPSKRTLRKESLEDELP